MPKKTKKEKIIAQLRRKLETTVNYQLPELVKTPETKPVLITENNLGLILGDLHKTFFLAGLAISLEFIIYWFSELGGSKLLKFLPMFK